MTSSENRPKPKRPFLAVAIVLALAIVAANLGIYLFFRASLSKSPPAEVALRTEPAPTSVSDLAVEQREAGIRALRTGAYARAVASFEAARALDPEVRDVDVLLDVARRLASQVKAGTAQPEASGLGDSDLDSDSDDSEPEPEVEVEAEAETPPAPEERRRRARPVARRFVRPRPAPAPSPPEAPPEKGTLLVVTSPEGLLVEVDDRPVEITPARLILEPGRHRIRLRKGKHILVEKTVELAAGERSTLEDDLSKKLAALEAPAPPAEGALAQDQDLDLLALVDRGEREREPAAPTPAARTTSLRREASLNPEVRPTEPVPPSDASVGPPGLLVVWPGSTAGNVRRALGSDLAGITVRVLEGAQELGPALKAGAADAVMASPSILRANGLAPALRASAPGRPERYVAASLGTAVELSDLPAATLGVVDELGRHRMPIYVARLLGTARAPALRRVGKTEDLLPLLQFSMVKAVLVKESDFGALKSRTQQQLFAVPIEARREALAVAFVDGGRGSYIERALLRIPETTKLALGVEAWTR